MRESRTIMYSSGEATVLSQIERKMKMKTFGNVKTAKHTYEVGTVIDGNITKVEVHANGRSQAANIVKREGLEVRDVNMVG